MKAFMKLQKSKFRFGFTLVELLVVIAIMGTLMSMVLPAISGVRESGRKTVCLNNMRQLGIAMEGYVGASNLAYPGFRGNKLKYMNDASWTVMLLPFYDESAEFNGKWQVAGATSPDKVTTASFKPSMNCASDPPFGTEVGYTSYVYNCGISDTGVQAQKTYYHNRANGVGLNRRPDVSSDQSGGAPNFNTKTTLEDNKSMTLMFSENIQAGTYGDVDEALVGFIFNPYDSAVSSPPSAPIGATPPTPVEFVNGIGAGWTKNGQPDQIIASIVPTAKFSTPTTYNTTTPIPPNTNPSALLAARPSSYHPLTVNAGMADSSTRSLNENIDYKVYQYLMTTDHKRSTMSTNQNAQLEDNINDSQL